MNTTKLLKLLSLLIWIPLLSACGPNTGTSESEPVAPVTVTNPDQEDQRLAAFFSEIFERDVSQSPEFQAYLEIKTEDYGRWDDYSDQYAQEINRQTAADLERLHTEFDYDALSDSAKLSYRIFEYNQQRDLRNFEWRFHDYAISPMNDIASDLPTFLQNIHKIETRKDAEDYISRLAGIQTVMAQVIEQLQLGESIGVIPPMMVYPKVLPGAQNVLQGAPFDETAEDGILLTDFRSKLDSLELDTEEKDILLNDAANALSGPFRNGYQSLIAELTRLQAIANNDHGVWSLPDGEAFYANRIQNWTTVAGTPEELHQLGLSEVARIRSEMQQIMNEVGFEGDLAGFFEYVRTNPENYYENTDEGREEYIRDATVLIEGIYDIADEYFNVLPKAPLEVRRVEPWRESASSTAFYNRPSPDGSRPGIYYINQQNMNAVQKHIMNSLAYHEGAPGHHFQLTIQQELQGIPRFRLFGSYSAYSEGWALYSERLAFEAGLYEGMPMRNFGRLAEEMKRAVRLVVDTGMHYKQWPLEQSIEYMTANTPMATADIERQIKRYYVLPGQALSYKVGMLTILELRQRAMEQLGEDFDIREFHDVVLKNGAVPMQILEEVVDAYIKAEQNGSN
ncbi:MAG: DUF885 domain-containing protein [Xanthomonadales bacterium]|nr:DUF885 domain-containing protein [Xanthomonadales bacterium]